MKMATIFCEMVA